MLESAPPRCGLCERRSASDARSVDRLVLPLPPKAHLVTLPRQPHDKPQETCVAVNPQDPRHVVVSYHQAVGAGSDHHPSVRVETHVAWSANGGATWTVAEGTTVEGYRRSLDACVALDRKGQAFLALLAMDRISHGTRHGQYVRRSADGGRTWERSLVTLAERPETSRNATWEHKPWLIADAATSSSYAGNLYVSWDRAEDDEGTRRILFVRSTDSGETWSRPRMISAAGSYATWQHGTVGREGTVYLVWSDRPAGSPAREIAIATSHDGGESFDAPRRVARIRSDAMVKDFPRAMTGWPSVAIDPRGEPGRLFVVWADNLNGDVDVLATTSDDGGRSWTAPLRVNDDPLGNGTDQVMPWVTVDPTDGVAYVLFYDRRDDPGNRLATVTLARSTDGGRTFANYAWSGASSDPKQACLGDYIGLAVLNGLVYAAWPESLSEPPQHPRDRVSADMGGMILDDLEWPYGPTAIRIGLADFRSAT
jgi:hypothetical protein